jgi:hypothetical protein
MANTVTVHGVPETTQALEALAGQIEQDEQAAQSAAAIVAPVASRYAPVDTGALAGSYNAIAGEIIIDVPYANIVELGSPFYGTQGQYTIARAWDEMAEQVEQAYAERVAAIAEGLGFERAGIG